MDSDAYEGMLRALSVVADQLITTEEQQQEVPIYIDALYEVLHHGEERQSRGDSHRFTLPPEQDKSLSMVRRTPKL